MKVCDITKSTKTKLLTWKCFSGPLNVSVHLNNFTVCLSWMVPTACSICIISGFITSSIYLCCYMYFYTYLYMCCVSTVCWLLLIMCWCVCINVWGTPPPKPTVLPDCFSSFPLLSKPYVSVRCFLLWHISSHLNFHPAQSDWCFKTETESDASLQMIHSLCFNQHLNMIKLACCSFSVSHWLDG